MKLLLATDGSPASREAEEVIRCLELPEGSRIVVLGVAESLTIPVSPIGDSGLGESASLALLERENRLRLEASIGETVNALRRPGVHIEPLVAEGDAADRILHTAESVGADLIVLGCRGLTGLDAFLLGSVARNVAKHARRPVLVARAPRNSLRRVVLATDGSQKAWATTEFAADLPLPADARIAVVNVQRPYHPYSEMVVEDSGAYQRVVEEVRGQRKTESARICNAALSRLQAGGKQGITYECVGDPSQEVLQVARDEQADLIIAGARGVSLLKGLIVGSVADRLLHSDVCSVLIVH